MYKILGLIITGFMLLYVCNTWTIQSWDFLLLCNIFCSCSVDPVVMYIFWSCKFIRFCCWSKVFGCIKFNPLALLWWVLSVLKDGVCFDPDCWLSCSCAFKGMCHLHGHVFQVLGYLRMCLSSSTACRLFFIVFWFEIYCWSLQNSTLLTAGMVLLCIYNSWPHRWYSCFS
jgi:hypothetical protein